MGQMSYGKMADDASEPSGFVSRRKQNGDVDITLLKGDDDEINRGLAGIVIGIAASGSLSQFMAKQGLGFQAEGYDITVLIDAYLSDEDWQAMLAAQQAAL